MPERIDRKKGTKLNIPVTCYSLLMTVAYGGSISQAIRPRRAYHPADPAAQALAQKETG